jgi:hypothetical protein
MLARARFPFCYAKPGAVGDGRHAIVICEKKRRWGLSDDEHVCPRPASRHELGVALIAS